MSDLGLEKEQLLILVTAIIILLILISRHRRKIKVKRIPTIQNINQPEIIGKKLYSHQENLPKVEDAKQHKPAPAPDKSIKDEKTNWKQTTKEWRKATEQIRLLRREVSKYKRTEEQLRQKISELTTSGQQTSVGAKENEHPGGNINHGLSTPQAFEIQEIQQGEQVNNRMEQSPQEMACNQNQLEEPTEKEVKNRGNSKRHGTPLDVQELKSIAELAKRLRRNNYQQQNK
jgi:protein-tyrosine phosphatase